jgi:hypothetical protein
VQPGAGRKPYRGRLRVDGAFYLELQFCDEHGLPHSQFLSWDPSDRSKAIAFVMEKAERCVMCGTAAWEWAENRRAYEPVEHFCQGCYLKAVANDDPRAQPGITIELLPTGTPEAAHRHIKAQQAWEARG